MVGPRLPRGVRLPAVLLVLVVVAATLGWGLFVHHPAPGDPDRPAFLPSPGEPLAAPAENESYRLTITMESEGLAGEVVRQRTYVPRRPPVVKDTRLSPGGEVVQSITYRSGRTRYVRRTYDDAATFREAVTTTNGAVTADQASLTSYRLETATRPAATIEPGPALRGLSLLGYERQGTTTYDGETAIRYEPTSGWVTRPSRSGDAGQSLYVRQASGFVIVDADTGAIRAADVSGSVVRADSWGGVMTADAFTLDVEFEVETGIEAAVSRPPWVAALNDTGHPTR
ncbi:MAG: hypothetical protein V5A23_06965 [Halobacteriales archaeon]